MSAPCRLERASRQSAPRWRLFIVRDTRVLKATNRYAVQIALVNRLWGTNALQLRRAIGSTHEHGHTRLVCLHHRRMKFDRRRTGGTQQDRGDALGKADTECRKRCTALVEEDLYVELRMGKQRKCHRC